MGQTWAVRYSEVTSALDAKGEPPALMLRTVEGELGLECRQLSGQSPRDYQGKQREALLAIVHRRSEVCATGQLMRDRAR